jgi:GDP/UDP-N,N'-diacetylbacillosamine 2-epimerase (hydrolysing)
LGERPDTVFNVGALGIENINKLCLLDKQNLEKEIAFTLGEKNLLVTFHPVTLEFATAEFQFASLLKALKELTNTKIIFTKANADTEGRIINKMIDEFVAENSDRAIGFTSLGQLRYLSLLSVVDAVVGNSSSGIIEAPAFKKPTVNIGDRQLGRIRAKTVIDCTADYNSIKEALNTALSTSFNDQIKDVENPYGTGNASDKIINVLKEVDLTKLLKKRFYDLQP